MRPGLVRSRPAGEGPRVCARGEGSASSGEGCGQQAEQRGRHPSRASPHRPCPGPLPNSLQVPVVWPHRGHSRRHRSPLCAAPLVATAQGQAASSHDRNPADPRASQFCLQSAGPGLPPFPSHSTSCLTVPFPQLRNSPAPPRPRCCSQEETTSAWRPGRGNREAAEEGGRSWRGGCGRRSRDPPGVSLHGDKTPGPCQTPGTERWPTGTRQLLCVKCTSVDTLSHGPGVLEAPRGVQVASIHQAPSVRQARPVAAPGLKHPHMVPAPPSASTW